jgi:transcriptional regulator with GAF, ATPase, and Fis domain
MNFASYAGARIVSLSLIVPLYGLWTADVLVPLDGSVPDTGAIVIGNATYHGAVLRQALYGGSRRLRIIGGFGGWRKPVQAQQYRLSADNRALRSRLEAGSGLADQLWGDSAAMRELRQRVLLLAPTPADVLVSGETGAGRVGGARAARPRPRRAVRRRQPAALPRPDRERAVGHEVGAFTGAQARTGVEHAQRGTLFLDEIPAMPATAGQAAALRRGAPAAPR